MPPEDEVPDIIERMALERAEKWDEWWRRMPPLKFKEEWGVKIAPPSVGAMVRFVVSYKEASVSVYFDVFNRLGYMSGPYWEIWPYEEDTARFMFGEEDNMMKAIEYSINYQLSIPTEKPTFVVKKRSIVDTSLIDDDEE
jgi:hypothetical protein